MKGHAEIILTDVATGEVKTVSEDNIVTNAVQDLIRMNPAGYNNTGIPWGLPICPNAIGGVLLFPDTIIEDPDEYYAPTGLVPVGYASSSVDTSLDTKRGSYNANDSGKTANGYKLVWDFGTADANGTIECVCLTSAMGGIAYFGSPYAGSNNSEGGSTNSWCKHIRNHDITPPSGKNDQYHSIGALDDGHVYGARNTGPSTVEWNVWERTQSSLSLSQDNNIDTGSLVTTNVALDGWYNASGYTDGNGNYSETYNRTLYPTSFSNWAGSVWDGTDFYRYFWETGKAEVSIARIRNGQKTEWTMDYGDVTLHHASYASISNGYLYAYCYRRVNNTCGIYRLSLADESDVTFMPLPVGADPESVTYYPIYSPFCDGRLYTTWNSTTSGVTSYWAGMICDTTIERAYRSGNSTYGQAYWATTGSTNRGFRMGPYMMVPKNWTSSYYGWYLCVVSPYLATINNLAEPITKTSAQTMKIVYTLTEE